MSRDDGDGLHSGPADAAHVHHALLEAGVAEEDAPVVCLGCYACMIGLAVGEVSGLVAPIDDDEADELLAAPDDDLALMHRVIPAYRALAASRVFSRTLGALADGIATAASATRV